MHFDVTTLDDVNASTIIAKRKSHWPCDACVIHARFARDEIINLAARGFARNHAKPLPHALDCTLGGHRRHKLVSDPGVVDIFLFLIYCTDIFHLAHSNQSKSTKKGHSAIRFHLQHLLVD